MLYLYGLIDTPETVNYTCAGREIFNVAYNQLSALVSQGHSSMSRVNEENVLAHGEVLKGVIEAHAILPVRFGALLESRSEVEGLLARNYNMLLSSLGEARGMVEMSVRALWDAREAEENCRKKIPDNPEKELSGMPGTAFLMQKKRRLHWHQCLKDMASAPAEDIHRRFSRLAIKQIKRILPSPGMFYHGSHMIKRECVGEFGEEFKSYRDSFPQYKFLLSGPWPLYSFVSIKCR